MVPCNRLRVSIVFDTVLFYFRTILRSFFKLVSIQNNFEDFVRENGIKLYNVYLFHTRIMSAIQNEFTNSNSSLKAHNILAVAIYR